MSAEFNHTKKLLRLNTITRENDIGKTWSTTYYNKNT